MASHVTQWIWVPNEGDAGKESSWQYSRCRRPGFNPWIGKIPGGGHCNSFQNSCLGNPMDRGTWQATIQFSLVQFSCSVVSDSLRPHGMQHTRPPCLSPTPGVYSNSCPLSQWCHPAISSSVPSSCSQSLPASGSFPVSQLFTSDGQRIGVSASTSVLPMNTQDWSPLGWTGWISLQSKGLSRIFSNTTLQKH